MTSQRRPRRKLIVNDPYRSSGWHWVRGEIHTHVDRAAGSPYPYGDGSPSSDIYTAASEEGLGFVCMSVDANYTQGVAAGLGDAQFGDVGSGEEHEVIGIPGREIQNNYYMPESEILDYFIEPGARYLHVLTIGVGGLSICLHPRHYEIANPKSDGTWSHIKSALLNPVSGGALKKLKVSGIEIYNGFLMEALRAQSKVHLYSDFDECCWDDMLMEGRRYWGFVGNDSFFESDDDFDSFQPMGAVYAGVKGTPTATGILDALRRGRFYSSTGVTLADDPLTVTQDGNVVRLHARATEVVNWTLKAFRRMPLGWALTSEHVPNAMEATFEISPTWKYLRVRCENPHPRLSWRRAWLQPITNAAYFS